MPPNRAHFPTILYSLLGLRACNTSKYWLCPIVIDIISDKSLIPYSTTTNTLICIWKILKTAANGQSNVVNSMFIQFISCKAALNDCKHAYCYVFYFSIYYLFLLLDFYIRITNNTPIESLTRSIHNLHKYTLVKCSQIVKVVIL